MARQKIRPKAGSAVIAVYIGAEGVVNVAVQASSSVEATRGHELLSLVTEELRALHLALLAAGIKQELEDRASAAVACAIKGGVQT